MTPAAAATPFMTLRLSIFGESFPSGQRDESEQAERNREYSVRAPQSAMWRNEHDYCLSPIQTKRVPNGDAKGQNASMSIKHAYLSSYINISFICSERYMHI